MDSDKIQASKNEATSLLLVVEVLCSACAVFADVGPQVLNGAKDVMMMGVQSLLKQFIQDTTNTKKQKFKSENKYKLNPEYASQEEKDAIISADGRYGEQWIKKYELIAQFRDDNGHADVPRSHASLGEWGNTQRRAHRKGKLSTKKVEVLTKLGFSWEVGSGKSEPQWAKQEAQCNSKYEAVQRHVNENDGLLPRSGNLYKILDKSKQHLRAWINTGQYRGPDDLAPERLEKLKSIGAT